MPNATDLRAFNNNLKKLLFESAMETKSILRSDERLLGAAILERGGKCPNWICSEFIARCLQDTFGTAYFEWDPKEVQFIIDDSVRKG